MYQRIAQKAEEGASPWTLFFSPWFEEPAYAIKPSITFKPLADELVLQKTHNLTLEQLAWRRNKLQLVDGNAHLFSREYPATVAEAFTAVAHNWLQPQEMQHITRVPRLHISADKNFRYSIGVDVALGNGNDFSAIAVVCKETHAPVFMWRSNTTSLEKFAEKVADVYHDYGRPITVIEANSFGITIVRDVQKWGVLNLYNKDGKNFYTSAKTKWPLLERLRAELPHITVLDSTTCDELLSMEVDDNKPDHAPASRGHDDGALALALAYEGVGDSPFQASPGMMHSVRRNVLAGKATKVRKSIGGFYRR
jgi:hypothetical protein